MIIHTTRARYRRMQVAARTAGDERIVEHLIAGATAHGNDERSKVDIEVCYSAAKVLEQILVDRCFTAKSTMRRGLSSSEFGAHRDVVSACNAEWRHPALRGIGMASHEAQVFPVWSMSEPDEFDRIWSPMPLPGRRFVILAPVWHLDDRRASEKMTWWTEDGVMPSGYRLGTEALHWSFLIPRGCDVTPQRGAVLPDVLQGPDRRRTAGGI